MAPNNPDQPDTQAPDGKVNEHTGERLAQDYRQNQQALNTPDVDSQFEPNPQAADISNQSVSEYDPMASGESATPTAQNNPFESPQASSFGASVPKKFWTKRKKVFISILVAIMIVLGAGAGAAFAYYTNANKALGDALTNALLADSSHVVGDASLSSVSDGRQISAKIDYDIKSHDKVSQADLKVKASVPPMSVDFSGGMITDADGNFYFKIDHIKQIIQNIFGINYDETDPSMSGVNGIVEMLDGKWVKIDSEYLKQDLTKEEKRLAECRDKIAKDMTNGKDLQREIAGIYKEHIFIKPQDLGSDDLATLHYSLTFDEQIAIDFAKALERTELYKRIKACDNDFQIEKDQITRAVNELNKMKIEVWIDRWSHTFKKITASSKINEISYAITANTSFDSPMFIAIPANSTPIEDVVKEMENVFGGMYSPVIEEETYDERGDELFTANGQMNSSVLSARTFRWLPW